MKRYPNGKSAMPIILSIVASAMIGGCGGGTSEEDDKAEAASALSVLPLSSATGGSTRAKALSSAPLNTFSQVAANTSTATSNSELTVAGGAVDAIGFASTSTAMSDVAVDTGSFARVSASSVSITPQKTVLAGTGLLQDLESGCSPVISTDFIDSALWHTRRLLPMDCAVVRTNTPQFSWTQPGDRDTTVPWIFTLRRAGSAEIVKTVQSMSPRVSMSSPLLAVGNYDWDVSYTTKAKRVVQSAVRRFQVENAGAFVTWPSGQTLASRVAAKSHPRLLPVGSSFAAIAASANSGEYKAAYTGLINAALQAKTAAPLLEPTANKSSLLSPAAYNVTVNALKNDLALERRHIEALGLIGRFTNDASYTATGVTRLMALAAWDPQGITSEASQDQSNREIYLALAQGLDLYSAQLSAAQVATVVTALKNRVAQARTSIAAIDTYPYNPHPLNAVQYVLEALLYSVGTAGFPEANQWLAEAYETVINTADTFQTQEGGFGNGVTYGWYAMTRLPYTIAAMRIMGGIDLTQHPSIGQFGNFLIAFTAPNGSHSEAFGDDAQVTNNYQLYALETFRLYAALTRNPVYQWYWRAVPQNITKVTYPGAWPLMTLGLGLGSLSSMPPTSLSWFFPDAGVAAMHSNTADALRSSIYFRSSRFGSFNHSHADQNSFTMVSGGKSLLISGGYYPYYMSPHHATVTRATRYKNALTFDGGIGQAEPVTTPTAPGKPVESMDARGKLITAYDNGSWAIATGDATLAYRGYDSVKRTWAPLLDNAFRSVAYNRTAKIAVIYDWATSAKSRRWELNFNALNAFKVEGSTATVTNAPASACINVYGPVGAYTTSKGFAVAPEVTSPEQYQLRFSTSSTNTQLASVTVIREDCRVVPVTVTVNGTQATVSIADAGSLVFDRSTVTVP